jgi:FtsP/CotA-like multicopper oxidase with cupredoxin domain
MIIQPVDYFLVAWFALAALSTAYVAWDQFRNNPEPVVMKWGFILVTLYMGPLGLLMYVMADKEPRPGEHEEFVKPVWKQGVGSTIHCVAGDATGIILAAVVTATLGLPMWIDLIVEYVAGFAFGLFIFQALFMKSLMGGTYWENVKKSILPEFISMNLMMAAMAPVMALLMMGRDMRAMDPAELLFWGVMSLGIIAGFALAYPVNVWMVGRGLKHGLMTERKPGGPFDLAAEKGPKKPAKAAPKMAGHAAMASTKVTGKGKATAHAQAGHDMGAMNGAMGGDTTRPQLAAVAGLSALALVAALVAPANFVNLRLSARDVGGLIMPPGMTMDRDTPADAMRDMAAVLPRYFSATLGLETRGDQELAPRIEDGVKVFDLDASVVRWRILPGVDVGAYAFNKQVPGPRLRFRQGDKVRINVTNHLPDTTSTHWHGLILPNVMDGPANVTQKPIARGETYRYEFTAVQSGTYFYHSHDHVDRQQALGLYGAIIIDPAQAADDIKADKEYTIQLQEWLMREGLTYPAMPMDGGQPNYFTINGRAFPATDVIRMNVGETLKVRFIGSNTGFIHPMHIHGGPFTVVARDGETLAPSARYKADTVNVGPGQRYDVIWPALKPGKWLIHCHIAHHTTNNGVEMGGGGGLTMVIDVAGDTSR